MKKLIALILLCLPLVCQGGVIKGGTGRKVKLGGVNQPAVTRQVEHSAMASRTISPFAQELRKYVFRAMHNARAKTSLGKGGAFYARRYINRVRNIMEEGKMTESRANAVARVISSVNKWKENKAEIPLIEELNDLEPVLMDSQVGGEVFGPPVLIQSKGIIATAVPTKIRFKYKKGGEIIDVKPLTWMTIEMQSAKYMDWLMNEAPRKEDLIEIWEDEPTPFHNLTLHLNLSASDIRKYALTARSARKYALDKEHNLFEIEHGAKGTTFRPRQRILFEAPDRRLLVLSTHDRLWDDGRVLVPLINLSFAKPDPTYSNFRKSVLEDNSH